MITWMPVEITGLCAIQEVLKPSTWTRLGLSVMPSDRNEICCLEAGFHYQKFPLYLGQGLGISKMNKGIVKEGILGTLDLRWQSLFKNTEI
jgi:dolichol-phosphate mannosyltransferase